MLLFPKKNKAYCVSNEKVYSLTCIFLMPPKLQDKLTKCYENGALINAYEIDKDDIKNLLIVISEYLE